MTPFPSDPVSLDALSKEIMGAAMAVLLNFKNARLGVKRVVK